MGRPKMDLSALSMEELVERQKKKMAHHNEKMKEFHAKKKREEQETGITPQYLKNMRERRKKYYAETKELHKQNTLDILSERVPVSGDKKQVEYNGQTFEIPVELTLTKIKNVPLRDLPEYYANMARAHTAHVKKRNSTRNDDENQQ